MFITVKTLGGANWLDPNEVIEEEGSTFDEVTAHLRILAGDVDVDKFLDSTMGDTNAQRRFKSSKRPKVLLANSTVLWLVVIRKLTRKSLTALTSL